MFEGLLEADTKLVEINTGLLNVSESSENDRCVGGRLFPARLGFVMFVNDNDGSLVPPVSTASSSVGGTSACRILNGSICHGFGPAPFGGTISF